MTRARGLSGLSAPKRRQASSSRGRAIAASVGRPRRSGRTRGPAHRSSRSTAWAVVALTWPASVSKSAARQVERPQALKHESPDPVHRPGREPQLRLVKASSIRRSRVRRWLLVVAPVLRAQHASVRGDDAQVRVRGERVEDSRRSRSDPRRPSSKLGAPLARRAGQRVAARHSLFFVCTFSTSSYGSRARVDERDRRQDVAPVVVDIEHAHRYGFGRSKVSQSICRAGGVGDEQVEGNRDVSEVLRATQGAALGSSSAAPRRPSGGRLDAVCSQTFHRPDTRRRCGPPIRASHVAEVAGRPRVSRPRVRRG